MQVRQMPHPDYPLEAREKGEQGTVVVTVLIGADGKVFSVKGIGPYSVLVQASEENARGWLFGPLPRAEEYPIERKVTYRYRLVGEPQFVVLRPSVKTDLPDTVEIVATPLGSEK